MFMPTYMPTFMELTVVIKGWKEKDTIEELLSKIKLTHDNCKEGAIECFFEKNRLLITCKKCGESNQISLMPGRSDSFTQQDRVKLMNFLTNRSENKGLFMQNVIFTIKDNDEKYITNKLSRNDNELQVKILQQLQP